MEWTCHICGSLRPDSAISVYRTDTSEEYGLPPGTMFQNVRFCNDNVDCIRNVPEFRFAKKE